VKRILVLGSCGAGKSTLAKRLGARLGLPVVHMDVLSWDPGWTAVSQAELLVRLEKVLRRKAWVIDGNYGSTLDFRLRRADTVVYLDINKWICRFRVIQRWLTWFGRNRPDMGPGCPEKMDWEFFMWVWNFDRSKTLAKISALGPKHRVFRLRNSKEVEAFVASLEMT
jgi:adenylate kinase family enzyme